MVGVGMTQGEAEAPGVSVPLPLSQVLPSSKRRHGMTQRVVIAGLSFPPDGW
jgi:hypothetical protein